MSIALLLDRGPVRRALFLVLSIGGLGVLSPWLSRGLGDGRLGWLLDLASHWQQLWLPLALLGCLALRRWALRLIAALLLVLICALALPRALPDAKGEPGIRVVSANVNLGNQDPAPLAAWLQEREAELLILVELNSGYAAALRRQSVLPHWHVVPSDDSPWGLGLASAWPLSGVRLERNADGIPRLRARVEHPSAPFEIVALHPMPPLAPHWHARRNADLRELRADAPALLAGDLNASPWSSAVQLLQQNGWRRASGLQPTWPNATLGIAIDAVWALGPWSVREHQVGPSIGSDHRPLFVELRLGGGG